MIEVLIGAGMIAIPTVTTPTITATAIITDLIIRRVIIIEAMTGLVQMIIS